MSLNAAVCMSKDNDGTLIKALLWIFKKYICKKFLKIR